MAHKTVTYGDQNMMIRHLMMDKALEGSAPTTTRSLIQRNVMEVLNEGPLPVEYRDSTRPGLYFEWILMEDPHEDPIW